jgi:hypothetical protein
MSTIALIGADTLLGREIRDIVATSSADIDLRLVADIEEVAGALTRVGDEPAVVSGLPARAPSFSRARRTPAARRWSWRPTNRTPPLSTLRAQPKIGRRRVCARRWWNRPKTGTRANTSRRCR